MPGSLWLSHFKARKSSGCAARSAGVSSELNLKSYVVYFIFWIDDFIFWSRHEYDESSFKNVWYNSVSVYFFPYLLIFPLQIPGLFFHFFFFSSSSS